MRTCAWRIMLMCCIDNAKSQVARGFINVLGGDGSLNVAGCVAAIAGDRSTGHGLHHASRTRAKEISSKLQSGALTVILRASQTLGDLLHTSGITYRATFPYSSIDAMQR